MRRVFIEVSDDEAEAHPTGLDIYPLRLGGYEIYVQEIGLGGIIKDAEKMVAVYVIPAENLQ